VPELGSAYLIGGSDRPKVELAIQRLRAHFDDASIDRLDAADADGAAVVAACNAGTLFGDRRLVIVEQVDGRPTDENRMRATWKAADVEAVVGYLGAPAEGAVLCLVAYEIKKDARLTKAVSKLDKAAVLSYEIARRETAKWVSDRFRAAGTRADAEAVHALIQLVGEDDKHALAQEVDKLAVWATSDGDTQVTERDVHVLVAPSKGAPPWELTDAWGAGDPAAALRVLERILHQAGATKHREEASRLSATLGAHLAKLHHVRRAMTAGERAAEFAQRTKQHRFPVEKLYRQVEGMSAAELEDATVTLARLDHALKGGSKLSPELSLQRAVTDLVGGRARHT
jgi:DNA polymerase III delta subunit